MMSPPRDSANMAPTSLSSLNSLRARESSPVARIRRPIISKTTNRNISRSSHVHPLQQHAEFLMSLLQILLRFQINVEHDGDERDTGADCTDCCIRSKENAADAKDCGEAQDDADGEE